MKGLTFDLVELRQASKVFGAVVALRGASLAFESGKITALVGHNGAGKSTLLSLLATLTSPTTGEILYGGHFARDLGGALRASIGLASDQPMGYGELTGRENVLLQARLHHLSTPLHRVDELIEALGLAPLADRPMAGYSQGERRRVGLARALVHRPHLLLLDEPSAGLDARGAELLVELLRSRREAGAIVVLATHDPLLGAALADRVAALRRGQVVFDDAAPSGEPGWRELLGGLS